MFNLNANQEIPVRRRMLVEGSNSLHQAIIQVGKRMQEMRDGVGNVDEHFSRLPDETKGIYVDLQKFTELGFKESEIIDEMNIQYPYADWNSEFAKIKSLAEKLKDIDAAADLEEAQPKIDAVLTEYYGG